MTGVSVFEVQVERKGKDKKEKRGSLEEREVERFKIDEKEKFL
jgi:hypothetical protein